MEGSVKLRRALLCGLFSGAAAGAQGAAPRPPAPRSAPLPQSAVTVLGEVDVHRVPLGPDATVLDGVVAAKARQGAALDALVLVRGVGVEQLVVRVDVRKMLLRGDTTANVLLRDGDLLVVPSAALAAATTSELEVVDAVGQATAPERWPTGQRARFAALRLLVEKDPVHRQQLVVELAELAADGAGAVAPLVSALGGDPVLARDAAVALGMLGAAAAPALPELRQQAASRDPQLAARCVAAIKAIEAAAAQQTDPNRAK
jgi:hypothetical protein